MNIGMMSFQGVISVKNLPGNEGEVGSVPGSGRILEKEMATHSSILAWEIPWTVERGRLHTVYGVAKSQTQLKR